MNLLHHEIASAARKKGFDFGECWHIGSLRIKNYGFIQTISKLEKQFKIKFHLVAKWNGTKRKQSRWKEWTKQQHSSLFFFIVHWNNMRRAADTARCANSYHSQSTKGKKEIIIKRMYVNYLAWTRPGILLNRSFKYFKKLISIFYNGDWAHFPPFWSLYFSDMFI